MLKRAKRLLLVLFVLAYLLLVACPVSILTILLSVPYWILTGNSAFDKAESILSAAWVDKCWIWLIS
jgi:hypothetical protein